MSGWDVSSTPTWGSQDGPEETQAFSAQGNGARDYGQDFGAPEFGGGYAGENMAGGPPPEFFGQDYGQEHDRGPGGYPQRTPGQSFQDLPRRGRQGGAPAGGGYGQESAYGQDNGYPQESAYGQDHGYGQESGYGQDNGYGHDSAFGQDWGGSGADQGDSWGAQAAGGHDDGGWGRSAGRSAAPWDERSTQDAGYGAADGFGGQDYGRQQDGFGGQQDGFGGQDYAGHEFGGQQGRGQAPMDFGRDGTSARNDPALQDFFSPSGNGGFSDPGPGWSGGERPRLADDDVDWTGRPKARPAADADVDWTGRPRGQRPAPRGSRQDDDDDSRGGIGMKGLVAIGAVVVVVIAAAAYMFLHKGSSTPTASNTPAGGMSSPAAAPSATSSAKATGSAAAAGGGAGATTAAYTLSTPNTAGGLTIGNDPMDLTNAKATAQQIVTALSGGGGGTVKGTPVSAAYTLPGNQAMTFVGYQGTFTPAKVATILATLGADAKSYPAGANGGLLGCANTKTTPSGAVCVWSTSSTLGITEFFSATGPEALTASQSKGADHTVQIRADVEKKK